MAEIIEKLRELYNMIFKTQFVTMDNSHQLDKRKALKILREVIHELNKKEIK